MTLNVKVGSFSIHSQDSISFMERLNPSDYVLSIMRHGLQFDLKETPPPYFEPNNQSCIQNLSVAQSQVEKWLKLGIAYEVKTRPYVCSPLTVSAKTDYLTGEVKLRPCLDLSRHINKYLTPPALRLEDLETAEKLLEPGCWQASWDLKSAYLHINVAPPYQKYLGFSLPDKSGKTCYYQFAVMIFGWSPAVFVMTALTSPLIAHLHKRGIKASIYIDDGRIVAKDEETARSHLNYALSVFEQAGWNVQRLKTSPDPVQKLYFLGYWCDTVKFQYSVAEFKLLHIRKLLYNLITAPKCKLKELAAVAGTLMAAVKAFGPVIPVMLRSSFYFISVIVRTIEDGAYETSVVLSARIRNDLKFLYENLRHFNGYPIFPNKIGFCLNSAIEEGDISAANINLRDSDKLWVSDSSDIKAVSYNPFKPGSEISVHSFSVTESQLSSSAREFLAIFNAVKRMESAFLSSQLSTLYWVTDSQVLTIWLKKGSKVLAIQNKVSELFRLLHKLKLRIIPIWKPRSNRLIAIADEASKFRDTDDWGVSRKSFKNLEFIFNTQFTLDVFANGTNWKVSKFFTKVAALGSSGINAFMQDWSQDICFVCPPVNLVIDAYKYIASVPCKGVLVIPHWRRNPFWPVLTIDGIHLQQEFARPFHFYPDIVTGPEHSTSSFQHGVRKKMIAVWFNSTIGDGQYSPLSQRCLVGGCGVCIN